MNTVKTETHQNSLMPLPSLLFRILRQKQKVSETKDFCNLQLTISPATL